MGSREKATQCTQVGRDRTTKQETDSVKDGCDRGGGSVPILLPCGISPRVLVQFWWLHLDSNVATVILGEACTGQTVLSISLIYEKWTEVFNLSI